MSCGCTSPGCQCNSERQPGAEWCDPCADVIWNWPDGSVHCACCQCDLCSEYQEARAILRGMQNDRLM